MAKDPCVLWYWQDWHGGTYTMSRAIKGAYMDLLFAQFNNGHLSLDEIKTVLASDFGSMWPTLQKKFVKDDNGLYYNPKAKEEREKRKNFSESRRKNLKSASHMEPHMENENEILILKRKESFVSEVLNAKYDYPEKLKKEFCEYWTERKPNGKKMRWEFEKVFDFSRRLSVWEKKSEEYSKGYSTKCANAMPDYYDRGYMEKLKTGPEIQAYQQHLYSKGLRAKKNTFGDIVDWVPEANLKVA